MNPRPKGLALVSVLWVVAALSLLVSALLGSVRGELQGTRQRQDALQAQAWGDAALLLTLQQLVAQAQTQWAAPARWRQTWAGQTLIVELRPASGWIDPNHAAVTLLADLLQHRGELPPDSAQTLAESIVAVREQTSTGAGTTAVNARFDTVADLMRVPGMPVGTYAKIADCLSVAGNANGKVNPMAAPAEVLQVLAHGRTEQLAPILAAQAQALETPNSASMVDTTFMNPQHIQHDPDATVRLAVAVGAYSRVWWVRLVDAGGPLPWQILDQQTLAIPTPP
jgi:general secretion pathway protein K